MNGFIDGPEEDNIRRSKAAEKASPAEAAQMVRIIAALNLIRMSLGMYPPGHAKIAESFDAAVAVLQKGFRNRPELTFNVTGKTLLFGATALDEKNTAVRDYVRTLNTFRILSFSLHRGLRKKDLIEFSRILSLKPADIWAQGKIDGILDKAGVSAIKVTEADAEIYNLTGEKKIAEEQARKKRMDESFWQNLVSRLGKAGQMDPKEAARALNEQRQHWQVAGLSYEAMVRDYFQEIRDGRVIGAEQQENLARVSSFIRDLHPELKRQFLEVVERQISLQPEKTLLLENLECFPQEIFLEIVRQANEKKSQISPALVMILQRMSDLEKDRAGGDKTGGDDLSRGDIGKLFEREEHEKYVPEGYDRILKRAVQTADRDDAGNEKFPIQEYLKTIEEERVGLRIGQFLIALMDEETPDEVYLGCLAGLMGGVTDLIRSGNFDFLTGVIETLRRHGQEGEKSSEPVRRNVISSLRLFSDPKYIATQVAPLIRRGWTDTGGMARFLTACGNGNVPWLFDLYLDGRSPASTALVDILKAFGRSAVDEAAKRLTGQGPQGIVQLLVFLRAAADKSVVACLKGLFDHEDWNVRREVIETLLCYNDPAAVVLLRRSLGSGDREELFNAVNLACTYRVRDLIEDLTARLKTFLIRDEDTILNDWIITQLGATGDPAFVPCLERISRIRFSLTPGQLARMKLILYGSLIHFPRESVQKMLERGKRSYHRRIKALCVKMLES